MSGAAPPGKIRLQVTAPPGYLPGAAVRVSHGGRQFDVTIPPGVPPGGSFLMEVDAAPSGRPAPPPFVPMGMPIDQMAAPLEPPRFAPLQRTQTSGRPIVPVIPRTQAEQKAECPICFEPLSAGKVGVFLDRDGKRVSQHYFNLAAAREWLSSGTGMCPLTRAPIARVLEVPDLRDDPDAWFRAVDLDGDRKLSRIEVVEALKAQLPIDVESLDAAASDPGHWMWQQWDIDGSGYIERNELLAPEGLVAYVRSAFARAAEAGAIPDLASDKEGWYRYWDEDNSGELDQEEVVRALLKTFHMTSDQAQVQSMRSTVSAVWPIFDDDMSGTIDRDEFLKPSEGLADTIIATLGLR